MDAVLAWLGEQLRPLDALLAPGTPELYLPVFTLTAVATAVANLALIAGMGYSASAGSRLVSQVHAAVASTLVACAFIPALGGRFITDADPADIGLWPNNVPEWQWAWVIPAITCGYILGDFVIVLMYKEIRDIPTVVHHFAVVTAMAASMHSGFGIILQAATDANELSTLFLNVHWATGYYMKHENESPSFLRGHWGLVRTVNGAFFWLTFTMTRIIGNIIVTYALYQATVHAWSSTWLGPTVCITNLGMLHVLNSMWWVALTKGLLKALKATFGAAPMPTKKEL